MAKLNGIVTLADSSFYAGARALINSIRLNSPCAVTVLDAGLEPKQAADLEARGAHVEVARRVVKFDADTRFGCACGFFDIGQAPYANILYIDADCLVLADLSDVFPLIERHGVVSVTAAPHKQLFKKNHAARVNGIVDEVDPKKADPLLAKLNPKARAPNTGVVGVRKDMMAKIVERAPAYVHYLDKIGLVDQGLFGLLLADLKIDWLDLGFLYNATLLAGSVQRTQHPKNLEIYRQLEHDVMLDLSGRKLVIKENRNPKGVRYQNAEVRVLHFSTKEKPWLPQFGLRDGFGELWLYYYDWDPAALEVAARLRSFRPAVERTFQAVTDAAAQTLSQFRAWMR